MAASKPRNDLKPVADAVAQVTSGLKPVTAEMVALSQGLGRVLAEQVTVARDQPPFPASAMDGYAVRGVDVETTPATLKLIGEAPAGGAFSGKVGKGEAVRVFTGAPIPDGCDRVIMQEDTQADGDEVTITRAPGRDLFVRPRGLDFSTGEVLLEQGTRLNARGLALAAAANQPWLNVRRKPRIAILATGNELVAPGADPRDDQIISSNSTALAGFVARFGGEPHDLGIARDTIDDLVDKTRGAGGADILVTIGGASVGDHDLVQPALKKAGLEVDFWRIAMRPGKPLMFGEMAGLKVLGLPGNPVSALVCARIFLKPMIDALLGVEPQDDTAQAILGADLPENGIRQAYLRARLDETPEGWPQATPFEAQDSSMLKTLHQSDCLVIRPVKAPAAKAGDRVRILRLDF